MRTIVALLRAVNITGSRIVRMADLRLRCEAAGFRDVRTYIQSGNLVCSTALSPTRARALLEATVGEAVGRPTRVLLRTAEELEAALAANPFPDALPARLLVLFLDEPPPRGALRDWPVPGGEQLHLAGRELFIHFPEGQGRSKLRIPFADVGTGRNLNTVRRLLAMARGEA